MEPTTTDRPIAPDGFALFSNCRDFGHCACGEMTVLTFARIRENGDPEYRHICAAPECLTAANATPWKWSRVNASLAPAIA